MGMSSLCILNLNWLLGVAYCESVTPFCDYFFFNSLEKFFFFTSIRREIWILDFLLTIPEWHDQEYYMIFHKFILE